MYSTLKKFSVTLFFQLLLHLSVAQYCENQSCDPVCTESCEGCTCSCPNGFELSGINCYDIDECSIMNGGCQHTCINTPGSFWCSCDKGYLLTGHMNCEAQSCDPVLEAPANGSMICDRQTVGGTCNFTCDESYTLRGSESRTCLPSLQWSGPPAICDPPMCPDLSPPENGLVLFPCTREEGHVCRIFCSHGYAIEGPSNQMCTKNSSGTVVWTEGPQCVDRSPCSSDPCQNGGYCIEGEGTEFTCVCNGTATGYGGTNCESVIVYFLPITPAMEGSHFVVNIHTDITNDFSHTMLVRVSRPNQQRVLTVTDGEPASNNFRSEVGLITVTLPENPKGIIYEPRERILFVSSQSERESYFERLNLTRGLLRPGCCRGDEYVELSCSSESTKSVSLFSSCQWSRNERTDVQRTDGVVFANVDSFFLPISILGMRYKDDPDDYLNDIKPNSACQTCSECQNNSDSCICYTHTAEDTFELLQARALAYTYISNIQDLLPPWLNLTVNLTLTLEDDTLMREDMLAQITQLTEPVSSFKQCEKLTDLVGSRYTVLRYGDTISAVIDGQRYDYTEIGTTGDVMCFAVDLCHESESPVHIQISQSINNILVSQYISQFTDRGWDITINTVSLYKQPFLLNSNNTFWNGRENFQLPGSITVDMALNARLTAKYTITSLCIEITCSGKSAANFRRGQYLFYGSMELDVISMINGDNRNFLITSNETEAYISIEETASCNTRDSGMFFSARYRPVAGDQFFTRLLLFNETTSSCPFNAFIPITSDYTVLGLSLHTQCPLLAIGELVLPEMSHNLIFIQSSNKDCFTTNFFGATNPALVIESNLVNPHLQLGNIFTLQSYSSGPDVVTVFEREMSGRVSLFHSVAVTMFGGRFESEARVRNDKLTISSSNASVFGYPAEITITAPTNKTDWQDLELIVEGSLLTNRENSLVEKMRMAVTQSVIELAERGNSQISIAHKSKERTLERLMSTMNHFDDTVQNVSRAERLLLSATNEVKTQMEHLRDLQMLAENSNLMEMLDELCTLELCQFTCVHGELCRSCATPQNPLQCPGSTSTHPPSFVTSQTTCNFDVQYVLRVNQTYTDAYCTTENDGTRPMSVISPARYQQLADVDINLTENCTTDHKEGVSSDFGICCEIVSCSAYAPNPSCLARNKVCESIRKRALDTARGLTAGNRQLMIMVLKTQSDMISAQISLRKTELEHEMHVERREKLNSTLLELKEQHNIAMDYYNRTLERVAPLLEVYERGMKYGFETVLNVTSVTFNTTLIISPTSLVMKYMIEKQVGDSAKILQTSYPYISTHSEHINLERIATDIINVAFPGNHRRQTRAIPKHADYLGYKGNAD